MLALLANRYTLLISSTQVKLMNGVECFQNQPFIITVNLNDNRIVSLQAAIREAMAELLGRRASIYVRVGYPFIKTDVLSPSNSHMNNKEMALRAKHLFESSYGEAIRNSEFRVDPAKYKRHSIAECIDSQLLQVFNSVLNHSSFKLAEITSCHSWLINSFNSSIETDALLFFQGDIYTYSLINDQDVVYINQFRCQIDQFEKVFNQQIKRAMLATTSITKLKKILFLTEVNSQERIDSHLIALKKTHPSAEIQYMAGML